MVHDSGKPVEMYVFLFDDLLLISRRKKGLGKKVCLLSMFTFIDTFIYPLSTAINTDGTFCLQLQWS